jgi:hypothetical protein
MNPLEIVKGDTVTLAYQIKEDGATKDITGMTFKLAVKERAEDLTFKITAVDGAIVDASQGKFSFNLTSVETDQSPFAGRMELAMYDSLNNKTTLTPAGGVEFRVIEDIV